MQEKPSGLTRWQTKKLESLSAEAVGAPIADLLSASEDHVQMAARIHESNRFVNKELAANIAGKIKSIADHWEQLSETHRYWIAGAIRYFVDSDDDENDFKSPIGFEDDAEVLNACLRMAGFDHLCIKEEEY